MPGRGNRRVLKAHGMGRNGTGDRCLSEHVGRKERIGCMRRQRTNLQNGFSLQFITFVNLDHTTSWLTSSISSFPFILGTHEVAYY